MKTLWINLCYNRDGNAAFMRINSFFFFVFFRAKPAAYGGYQARVQSELQLPAYTTATATWYPSLICNLHHSSQQCGILNPLSEARNQTHNFMVPSWIRFCCATMGTPGNLFKLVISCIEIPLNYELLSGKSYDLLIHGAPSSQHLRGSQTCLSRVTEFLP